MDSLVSPYQWRAARKDAYELLWYSYAVCIEFITLWYARSIQLIDDVVLAKIWIHMYTQVSNHNPVYKLLFLALQFVILYTLIYLSDYSDQSQLWFRRKMKNINSKSYLTYIE